MLAKLRRLILALNVRGQHDEARREIRRGLLGLAARLRSSADVRADVASFGDTIDAFRRETQSWVGPTEIENGRGGPFDARELRVYLALAERAGVPCVPAREILRLTEDEIGVASGPADIPDNAVVRGIGRMLRKALPEFAQSRSDPSPGEDVASMRALHESVVERAFAAMDDVPEGWMVRSNLCGSSDLKALAGSGVLDTEAATQVPFGPDLEIGPGWVRNGNRRRVNLSDKRLIDAFAKGAREDENVFVARPWITAARFMTSEDPHRHGTPFAGKGLWPAEWRAYVEGGRVRGVSFYYSWAGEATPENAAVALEVRRLAQLVADEAVEIGAFPRAMDMEFVRLNPRAADDPKAGLMLRRFPRDGVAFTLDFIETAEGLKVLEGGPAHTPLGMGHSCGFTGVFDPAFGNCMLVDGVAFRTLPGVHLAEPSTWRSAGDGSGCVLTWAEVSSLAAGSPPSTS